MANRKAMRMETPGLELVAAAMVGGCKTAKDVQMATNLGGRTVNHYIWLLQNNQMCPARARAASTRLAKQKRDLMRDRANAWLALGEDKM